MKPTALHSSGYERPAFKYEKIQGKTKERKGKIQRVGEVKHTDPRRSATGKMMVTHLNVEIGQLCTPTGINSPQRTRAVALHGKVGGEKQNKKGESTCENKNRTQRNADGGSTERRNCARRRTVIAHRRAQTEEGEKKKSLSKPSIKPFFPFLVTSFRRFAMDPTRI